jgi:hypothetical protein
VSRAAVVLLALAAPARAEDLVRQALCEAAWDWVSEATVPAGPVSGELAAMDGAGCMVETPEIDLRGQYVPDWHADRLRY